MEFEGLFSASQQCTLPLCFVCEFLATNSRMTLIPPPPYSKDLVLCDFFLFLELQMALKGWRFNGIAMIRAKLGDGFADFQTMHIMNALNGGMTAGPTV
jgi:hypothetical protein